MIFVQIASYRDPQLIPTVLDLIKNADYPKRLRIVVAWQHDSNESILPIKKYIKYIDIPYNESKGVCWARSLIQKEYKDEDFILQLDSHHRFVKGWDTKLYKLYDQCKSLGSSNPLLTAYLPHFDSCKKIYKKEVWQMNLEKFLDEGPLFFVPEQIPNIKNIKYPVPSRFFSGHFAFVDGDFIKKVPYDPNYYFFGEETNIGVRAFTHGYDLYHPHKIIGWHQYDRAYRHKHWEDHNKIINKSKYNWYDLDKKSMNRYKQLFENNENIGKYGFGNIRSLHEYEIYAGINFKNRTISEYTKKNLPPPNPIE
jgi:hypothetical protein